MHWQHFFIQGIVDRWNSLPAEVAEAPSLNAFKNRVDLFMRDYVCNKLLPMAMKAYLKLHRFLDYRTIT